MTQKTSTTSIFTIIALLQEPLTALQTIIPIFLLKEMHASGVQIAILTALLPTVSIFSFYWGSLIPTTRSGLNVSIVVSTLLAPIFFLTCIFLRTSWLFIAASAWYTLFVRASLPAKMEIVKRLFPNETYNDFYSRIFRVSYIVGMILAPIFGIVSDQHIISIPYLFAISGILHIVSSFFYMLVPWQYETSPQSSFSLVTMPWKESLRILKQNSDFRYFQLGFFIAGFGLMIAKPAGEFLLYQLHLPYLFLFICRVVLKGVGTIGSSSLWSARLHAQSVLSVSSFVTLGFLLFQLLLLSSHTHLIFVGLAYYVYGLAQGGSHLVWSLSGPLLSGNASSCQYSAINILAVGIRGCIAPLLGGLLFAQFGTITTISIGTICIGFGTIYLHQSHKKGMSTIPTS